MGSRIFYVTTRWTKARSGKVASVALPARLIRRFPRASCNPSAQRSAVGVPTHSRTVHRPWRGRQGMAAKAQQTWDPSTLGDRSADALSPSAAAAKAACLWAPILASGTRLLRSIPMGVADHSAGNRRRSRCSPPRHPTPHPTTIQPGEVIRPPGHRRRSRAPARAWSPKGVP